MLVIISDLHLTDGTTGRTISTSAFRDFALRLRALAMDASWRSNGRYEPIPRCHILLLGDILDQIRSSKWNNEEKGEPGYARPWDSPASTDVINKVGIITRAVLSHNSNSLLILQRLAERGIEIPPANANGQPDPTSSEKAIVDLQIHYMVGNHDWFLNLNHPEYEALRREVIAKMGLANPPGPFPHDPSESPRLQEIYRSHNVFARHGDIYDSFNYNPELGRGAATLGDAIVVDLINRFPVAIWQRMGDGIPTSFLYGLNELANVRPSLIVPVWVDGLIRQHDLDKATSKKVKLIWDDLADELLALPFVRDQDTWLPFDKVDFLQLTLRFAAGMTFSTAADAVLFIRDKVWGGDSSFAKRALAEKAFESQEAQYIVYGHTHHPEVVPLYTTMRDNYIFDQIYFNSGTWHPFHSMTIHHPLEKRFVHYHTMTYLAFFRYDERRGQPFETWSGTLGVRE